MHFSPLPILISGLVTAGIYALAVTGINLIILVGGVIYIVFPTAIVLSMYFLYVFGGIFPGNDILLALFTILAAIALVILTEPVFRRFGQRRAIIASFIVAIGLSTIFDDIITNFSRGAPLAFAPDLFSRNIVLGTGIYAITIGQLATLLAGGAVVAALSYLIYRTKIGRHFRAIALDPWAAKVSGIPTVKTSVVSYTIAGVLAGISAVLLSMYIGHVGYDVSYVVSSRVIMIMLLMGIGNLTGCLYGALIYGVVEAFLMVLLPGSQWATVILYGTIFIVIVFIRPWGIFGTKVVPQIVQQ